MLLRLPAFAWPAISDDEGIYDAMAQGINAGGVMYRDVLDHKPPGLAYAYAAVERWAGAEHAGPLGMCAVHALGALAAGLTALGLFLLARELLPPAAQLWPPLFFAASSTAKCAYDGLAVNGELLMNVPTVFAVWLVVRAARMGIGVRFCCDVVAGALMGIAALFKWQALLTGLAFPFFAPFSLHGLLRGVLTRGPAWLLGVSLPLAATALFFAHHGVLGDAIAWGLRFNAQYVAEGPQWLWAAQRLGVQLLAVVVPSALLYGCAAHGLRHRAQAGLVIWAAGAAFAVGIGGRFFGHYFLQLELPLCLLAAVCAMQCAQRFPKRAAAALGVPALIFATLASMPAVTRSLLDGGDPNWQAAGRAIAERSAPGDTLFVWGNAPLVYHHAQRRMGTRFAFCNYLTGLSPGTPSEYDASVKPDASQSAAWPALLGDLHSRRPTWLLDTAAGGWKGYAKFPIEAYPALRDHVATHYRRHSVIDGAVLYQRITQ